jgi:3-oxoacyl-[acyl-carrier protein] reductase
MSGAGSQLVVGGGGGLGVHLARALAPLGGTVVVADAALDDAQRVADDLVAAGHAALALHVDVGRPESVAAAVAAADACGGLAGVVNAAGVTGRIPFAELDEARWARVLEVNLTGAFRVAAAAVPVLRERGGGVIVTIASAAALRPSPGSVAYAAAKAGVVALSRSLAAEVAADGIRVWAVCPPAIETGIFLRMLGESDDHARRIAEEARRPLGRVITPQEVAALVRFLVEGEGPPYGAESYVV